MCWRVSGRSVFYYYCSRYLAHLNSMLYNRDPCMPYAAVGRWNPVEPNFQHEYAMNNQVSPDVSRLKRFCTLQAADGVPDVECVDAPANKDLSSHGGSGAAVKCTKCPTSRRKGNGECVATDRYQKTRYPLAIIII